MPRFPTPADRPLLKSRPWNVVVSRSLDVPLAPSFLAEPAIRPLFVTRAAAVKPGFPGEVEAWPGDGDLAGRLDPGTPRRARRRAVSSSKRAATCCSSSSPPMRIDEMHVTLCPIVVGGDAPTLADGAGFDRDDVRRLRLVAERSRGRRGLPALPGRARGRAP